MDTTSSVSNAKQTTSGAANKNPFYAPPQRKTSAEIINEARAALRESQMAESKFSLATVKPLQTQRPFTPRDKQRLLFGKKAKSNRPPSSFSLRYLQKEADSAFLASTSVNESTILTPNVISSLAQSGSEAATNKVPKKIHKSHSISEISAGNKVFDLGVKEIGVQKMKLPSLDGQKRKHSFKSALSLDKLPEENELPQSRSEDEIKRNAFSSPQERTGTNFVEEPITSSNTTSTTNINTNNSTINPNPYFGRPSKQQQNLSQCLILGPQNLENLFENKQIVQDSERLFVKAGYLNRSQLLNDTTRFASRVTTDGKNTDDQDKEVSMLNILERMNGIDGTGNNSDDDTIIKHLKDLFDCLEIDNLVMRKVSSKTKIQILKCLYRFVESQNDLLLIMIAKVILGLRVSGNNLSGVCKLIFKVAKNDRNDHLFLENNILELFIDALGRSSPLDDAEACVYGYGAVKFLTMNQNLLERILNLGILQLMILHMKIVNNCKAEKSQVSEQTNHAMYQLTGVIRNIATNDKIINDFVDSGAVHQLCSTITLFNSDVDIVSNVARTLSIISMHDRCCDAIGNFEGICGLFIKLFEKYPGKDEIIVRLAYTMGNLVAKLDSMRVLYYNEENSISCLITIWRIYMERILKHKKGTSSSSDSAMTRCNNLEDVMIKIIRIIANVSINADVGKAINSNYGKQLIDSFITCLTLNALKSNDELVLSILSTLNNLSFYYTSEGENDAFTTRQINVLKAIFDYTNHEQKEIETEAIRILGNLSRSTSAREHIKESGYFVNLLNLLNSDDIVILRATVGVLVNMMADTESRLHLKKLKGISKLINILVNYGQLEWSLSMLICQVIWNYSIDNSNLFDVFTGQELQCLLSILADYLDEEKLFGLTASMENIDILSSAEYIIWEEFANVATNLLEKIEHFYDTLDEQQLALVETIGANNSDDEDLCIPKTTKDSATNVTSNVSFTTW